ncbi:MAG: hypothetical protein ACOYCB_05460 [Fastidiosipilaceae bacterium]|jgi:hypothetical protein|nr:hypothetical protein [Clostridiaceae bacterium]
MGHLGFSYVGLLFLLMLFIPNLIWTKNLPEGYNAENESKFLRILERIGQVLTSGSALIFSDFNIREWTPWSCWLIAAFILMIMYELWWLRYFRSKQRLSDFYSAFLGVPVAGATLPVLAFLFLGIYGKVILLIVSVIILGIGHIGIHLQHKQEIKKKSL